MIGIYLQKKEKKRCVWNQQKVKNEKHKQARKDYWKGSLLWFWKRKDPLAFPPTHMYFPLKLSIKLIIVVYHFEKDKNKTQFLLLLSYLIT